MIQKQRNLSQNYSGVPPKFDDSIYEQIILRQKILATIDYSFYCEYVHRGNYQVSKHSKYICDILDKLERGEIKRLMIFMPPRHSKSFTVSETFPSYFIGKSPDRRVIEVSYGDSLARRFGRRNRQKIEEFGRELFDIEIERSNGINTNWSIEGYLGGMISSGIGGAITGEGADLLLIDDPIKNRKEANSITYREMVWDEWQNTLLTRLQPNGAVIIILTRWHEDDLAGRILDRESEKWFQIRLPAIAEENDLLGREIGQPLWPEFGFDLDVLEEIKSTSGSQVFNSLYQQRPSIPEGNLIKRIWFRFWDKMPDKFDQVIQSWDMTFKDAQSSKSGDVDYVVGQIWGKVGADKYLLDEVRGRWNFPDTIKAVRRLTEKWPQTHRKLVEDKANGPAIIAVLKKEIPGLIPVEPNGSKDSRLQSASADMESGNVYLPLPTKYTWVDDYIEEIVTFPNAKYDDRCDTTSQAINYLRTKKRPMVRMI